MVNEGVTKRLVPLFVSPPFSRPSFSPSTIRHTGEEV
jgi:hypothetical protein